MLNYCFAVYFVWRAQCVSETQMTVGVLERFLCHIRRVSVYRDFAGFYRH